MSFSRDLSTPLTYRNRQLFQESCRTPPPRLWSSCRRQGSSLSHGSQRQRVGGAATLHDEGEQSLTYSNVIKCLLLEWKTYLLLPCQSVVILRETMQADCYSGNVGKISSCRLNLNRMSLSSFTDLSEIHVCMSVQSSSVCLLVPYIYSYTHAGFISPGEGSGGDWGQISKCSMGVVSGWRNVRMMARERRTWGGGDVDQTKSQLPHTSSDEYGVTHAKNFTSHYSLPSATKTNPNIEKIDIKLTYKSTLRLSEPFHPLPPKG